jgi:hypothetical protein
LTIIFLELGDGIILEFSGKFEILRSLQVTFSKCHHHTKFFDGETALLRVAFSASVNDIFLCIAATLRPRNNMVFGSPTTTKSPTTIETMTDMNHPLVYLLANCISVRHDRVQRRDEFSQRGYATLKFKVCGVGGTGVGVFTDVNLYCVAIFVKKNIALTVYYVNHTKSHGISSVLECVSPTTEEMGSSVFQ